MHKGVLKRVTDASLANSGLLLLVLLGPLSEMASPAPGFARAVRAFFARRAIDAFAAIGWVTDRMSGLPPSSAPGSRHAGYGKPFTLTR